MVSGILFAASASEKNTLGVFQDPVSSKANVFEERKKGAGSQFSSL